MVKFEFFNDYCSLPGNSIHQILSSPNRNRGSIDLGLFNDHRFSFYYWCKWRSTVKGIPDLISFDWHQDLAYPEEEEKSELSKLDTGNLSEVAFYSWARLNPLNDNHILSAAYLDLIGDVWIVCKQETFGNSWEDEILSDINGKDHRIKKFKSPASLWKWLVKQKTDMVYFDIDLDYFTVENSTSNDKHFFSYISDQEIEQTFSPDSKLMKWIFKKLHGITIAMEPEHVGGVSCAMEYLKKIEVLWFEKPLGNWNCNWKQFNH